MGSVREGDTKEFRRAPISESRARRRVIIPKDVESSVGGRTDRRPTSRGARVVVEELLCPRREHFPADTASKRAGCPDARTAEADRGRRAETRRSERRSTATDHQAYRRRLQSPRRLPPN